MKTVYLAANITEAEILRGLLSSAGIESHVSGFYLQGGIGELAAADSARLLVDDDDLLKALEVIQDYDPQASLPEEPQQETVSVGSFWLVALLVLVFIALVSFLIG